MAIYIKEKEKFLQYIPKEEKILATLHSNYDGSIYCLTRNRLALLQKTGIFKWQYSTENLTNIIDVKIEEKLFKTNIICNSFDNGKIYLRDINKSGRARVFINNSKMYRT